MAGRSRRGLKFKWTVGVETGRERKKTVHDQVEGVGAGESTFKEGAMAARRKLRQYNLLS